MNKSEYLIYSISGDKNSKQVMKDHFNKSSDSVKILNIKELLKFEMDKFSKMGKQITQQNETGNEISIDIKIEILKQTIFSGKTLNRNNKIILLDGFPKNVEEANRFEKECGTIQGIYTIGEVNNKDFEELKL
jgi:adenylate kinase family enzyme